MACMECVAIQHAALFEERPARTRSSRRLSFLLKKGVYCILHKFLLKHFSLGFGGDLNKLFSELSAIEVTEHGRERHVCIKPAHF